MTKTQQEIIRQGYEALINSLGIIDTIRFIQYYSSGQGDYTQERHQWLDKTPPDEIFALMKQQPENDNHEYDEIIN
ncbi:hypothetical protein [Okeania sp. SIO1I7]|uniref:hypothetical protein n=1 Tax=Okeania sp. SIO1I7 TaxID=2607772 RepID=UPI0013FB76CA|nr:hypothetical protein [Okeania sp. SIO1I7]NET25470.1 hypothetical protein [Okeania sp. SIO1I7]